MAMKSSKTVPIDEDPEFNGIPSKQTVEQSKFTDYDSTRELKKKETEEEMENRKAFFIRFEEARSKKLHTIELIESTKNKKKYVLDPSCKFRKVWNVFGIVYPIN